MQKNFNVIIYMKIVVLDGYTTNPGDVSWDELKKIGETVIYERTSPEDVVERAKDAEIILTNKVCITETLIKQFKKLKYIGVLATGYNVVDLEAARKRGILVTNIPAYSTESVAQMVFAHLFNVTNNVNHYASENRKGRWNKSKDFCYWDDELTEINKKTIGIVGLGNIGRRVAEIAHAFGMTVIAETSKSQDDLPIYIYKVTREQLFAKSDVITLHCPLNRNTEKMINKTSLSKMKRKAILINTGRGKLVDDDELAEALDKSTIKAYCADVLTDEPPVDNPLLRSPNAYITPHIAWATREARERLIRTATENIRCFVDGHPQNVVNGKLTSLTPHSLPHMGE